jgi:hypothetical protein
MPSYWRGKPAKARASSPGGQYFTMIWAFFAQYVDEVYATADAAWVDVKGTTPGGLTRGQLEPQMAALKANELVNDRRTQSGHELAAA